MEILFPGVISVKKQEFRNSVEDLRLSPKFDPTSIAHFHVATREDMGFRVLDNCAEEHIM